RRRRWWWWRRRTGIGVSTRAVLTPCLKSLVEPRIGFADQSRALGCVLRRIGFHPQEKVLVCHRIYVLGVESQSDIHMLNAFFNESHPVASGRGLVLLYASNQSVDATE